MRRPMRLALFSGAAVLAILLAAYTAFWFVAAGKIEEGVGQWARSLHDRHLDLTWRTERVRGFPFAFRVEFGEARLRDDAPALRGEARLPLLSASARPWQFRVWRLGAPQGLSVAFDNATGQPAGRLTAQQATGSVVADEAGSARLWFGLEQAAAESGVPVKVRTAYLWLALPARPATSEADPALGVALDLWGVSLPFVPAPLHNPLDELALGVTVKGPIPQAPPREAAEAWRDAGGTVDLDHLDLRWGAIAVRASGTAALDKNLQPSGAFSGAVEGYPELLRLLVATGRMRRNDAAIADMALAFLAKSGPDGRPQIATSFTIQDGQMSLGPARLGPAPRIPW